MSPRIDPTVLKQQVDALLKTLADIKVEGDEMALGEVPAFAMAAPALGMAAAQAAAPAPSASLAVTAQAAAAAAAAADAGRSTGWLGLHPVRKTCGPLRPSPRNGFWPSTARSLRTTAAPSPFLC